MQRSFQLTLSSGSTVYNLYTLMQSIGVPTDGILPDRVNQFAIQFDVSNGTANLFVGDSALSTSNYGTKLTAGDSMGAGPTFGNGICLRDYYVLSDTAGTKINIIINSI